MNGRDCFGVAGIRGRGVNAYYNENNSFAAEWLRNLIARKLIAPGEVDERSIADVRPDDLKGFVQHHFFAGIGGWSYALRLAGFPDDRPIWTGSCPCQPYSTAGKRKGDDDPRNLWPVWFPLIAECGPDRVIGEQVPGAIGHGWLDGISTNLEGEGYACGAIVLGAHSVDAPNIRQRLFWVAHTEHPKRRPFHVNREDRRDGLGDPDRQGSQGWREQPVERTDQCAPWTASILIDCADGKQRRIPEPAFLSMANGVPGGVDAMSPEEGFPLAVGVENRVGALRGFGNAINPYIAAEFIRACP